LRVRACRDDDRSRWDEFVHQCPDATFFHRIGWKGIIEECFGHRTHYLLVERDDRIVGVLPLAEVKSFLFGHALVSLPFCAYGGVAATETEAVTALHESARQLGETLGVEHLELRDRAVRQPDWPRQELYVTFRKAILPKVDDNLTAIPRKQRAMVRKGVARGLVSRIDADVDRFFALYADNVHRHGTPPLAKRYFEALQRVFDRDCEVLTVVEPGGKSVSSVLSFISATKYCRTTQAISRRRAICRQRFRYWELLRRSCERGLRSFDFGRSKVGTVHSPSRRTGTEPTPLAYEYCLYRREGIPEHNPLNPKYRLLIALWRSCRPGREPRGSAPGQRPGMNEAKPMETLLFLSHRLPYPPNKGDKVRSYHLLRHLAQRYRIVLGTFIDDPLDWQHVEKVRRLCAEVHVEAIVPWRRRLRSLAAVLTGEALTLHYFRSRTMRQWVQDVVRASASSVRSLSHRPWHSTCSMRRACERWSISSIWIPRSGTLTRNAGPGLFRWSIGAKHGGSSLSKRPLPRGQRQACSSRVMKPDFSRRSRPSAVIASSRSRTASTANISHQSMCLHRHFRPASTRSYSPEAWTTGPTSMPSRGSRGKSCL
jgi:FemAB-related protein (PEP-CTERM system-associated)